jgi:hypothetical protein
MEGQEHPTLGTLSSYNVVKKSFKYQALIWRYFRILLYKREDDAATVIW